MATVQSLLRREPRQNSNSTSEISTCSTCPLCDRDLCAAAKTKVKQYSGAAPLTASVHTIAARRIIPRPNEWPEFVTILCEGWATLSIALPDGRRQILSFVLPGDIIPTISLFEPISDQLGKSVTAATYRNFKRNELQTAFEDTEASDRLTKLFIEDRLQADKLALALGRQTANERIAWLILNLMERLAKRGMAKGQMLEFPLRQQHIADALGLTPSHVSKIVSEFRHRGLIEISDRSLTILDLPQLRRLEQP